MGTAPGKPGLMTKIKIFTFLHTYLDKAFRSKNPKTVWKYDKNF